MIELQAHHCMTYNCEPDSCAVCFIPAKQLSLQESNQLIGIKMPTSGFPEIFRSQSQFPGFYIRFHKLKPAHLMKRKKTFLLIVSIS